MICTQNRAGATQWVYPQWQYGAVLEATFYQRAKPAPLFCGEWLGCLFSARWVPATRVWQKRGATLERPCYPRRGCAEKYGRQWRCWQLVVGCVLSKSVHGYWLCLQSGGDAVVRKNISLSWESPVGLYRGAEPRYV